jgi:4-hydroxy-3-polyprenylbenzoate decarboxylase
MMQKGIRKNTVVVGISGGSGAAVGKRVVDLLLEAQVPVALTASNAGRQVWQQEMEYAFADAVKEWNHDDRFSFHPVNQTGSLIASGTAPTAGMIVAPCSMATVAAITTGIADNLLRRAADVTIKERRRLVLMPRETPLSEIHLENMQKLARMGVSIMVPAPAFYLHPKSVDDIVEYLARKAIDALRIENTGLPETLIYTGMPENSTSEE